MGDDGAGNKVTGISQIVRLKEFIHKWQSVTLGSKQQMANQPPRRVGPGAGAAGISPAVVKRMNRGKDVVCDSDEECCISPEPPHDVPKGFLAVYVGLELRRFIIPTTYLSDPLFKVLLEKAEDEFGFDHCGGLTIPCEIETFKYLLNCMETRQRDHLPPPPHHDPRAHAPTGSSPLGGQILHNMK